MDNSYQSATIHEGLVEAGPYWAALFINLSPGIYRAEVPTFNEYPFRNNKEKSLRAKHILPRQKKPWPAKSEQYAASDVAFLRKAINLIVEDFSVQWQVPGLARKMLVSTTQFYRKLKSLTGMYPTEFVRYVRLLKACQLMQEHLEWSNTRIAGEVGFSSLSEFSNRFNELFGVRPTQWRKGDERQ